MYNVFDICDFLNTILLISHSTSLFLIRRKIFFNCLYQQFLEKKFTAIVSKTFRVLEMF